MILGAKIRSLAIMALALGVGLLSAGSASASQEIESFSVSTTNTAAGGHPDLQTSFTLSEPGAPEAARNVTFNAPEGLFGNPNAVTRCTAADFGQQRCPSDTQVGLITVYDSSGLLGTAPMFSMQPGEAQTALFAFIVPALDIPVNIPVQVRTASDYGLRFTVSEITQTTPLAGADLTFWGFPAEEANDAARFPKGSPGDPAGCPGLTDASCIVDSLESSLPEHPLTDNPTVCTNAPLVATLTVQTYQDPENPTTETATYPATTDCEKEVFQPVLFGSSTTVETDSASGLNIQLSDPQFLTRAVAPSQIRSAIVTLPDGFTINPDAADGQTSCSDAQANFASEGPQHCPDKSKIGTFALHTVALDGALEGSVYIGEPKPGNQYRLFMTSDGFGIHSKLEGQIVPDPTTGQLRIYFMDLPQVPFDDIQLHLFASDRGLMATPIQCRIYDVSAQFIPWNDVLADQTSVQHFSLNSGPGGAPCPGQTRPFNPRLVAGTTNPTAGAFSDFSLQLDRDDGDQFLGDLNFRMPPGFTGDLRGIDYCPESAIVFAAQNPGRVEQVSPSCPATSRIGTTNVAAGPGTHPFHAVGRMYLSGPLRGAPLSLVAVTPALAGPYDYGTVVIRVALYVDPLTAQVTAASEPVPQIIGGVPIRMRSIRVSINRSRFTLNPTSCRPLSVASQGIGDQGTLVDFSSYFQVVNCSTLGFKPKMRVRLEGKAKRRAQNPQLQFDLLTRSGDANLKSIAVTLSNGFEIDQRHLGNICSEKELDEKQCEGRTAIGKATTRTPLLDEPLSGPLYAVSGSGGLPRLAFILNGQVNLVPRADTETVKGGRLRTVAPVIPDAPIGQFALTIFGGKRGYLINTRDVCRQRPAVWIRYEAQNGKINKQRIGVRAACSKKAARHHSRRHRRSR